METSKQGCESLRHLPMAVALADLSGVALALGRIRAAGIEDLGGWLASRPGESREILESLSLTWFNEEARRLFGLRELPIDGKRVAEVIGEGGFVAFRQIVEALEKGEASVDVHTAFHPLESKTIYLRIRTAWADGQVGAWDRVLLFFDEAKEAGGANLGRFDEWSGTRKLTQNMSMGFALFEAIIDNEGKGVDARLLTLNPAFERMVGVEKEKVIGGMASAVLPGINRDWLEALCDVAREGKGIAAPGAVEFRGRHYEAKAYRPDPGLVAVLVQDISDAVRDMRSLAQRETLLRAILDTAAEGYFLTDSEGRFLDVNGAYCGLMGYSREEFLQMTILDQAAASSPELIKARLARIREKGHDYFETLHRRKDGVIIDVEVTSSFLPGPTDFYITFCRDITPRKKAERLFREQEERLSLAMSGTGAGLWDWDVVSGNLLVDVGWGAILGLGPAELRAFSKRDWDDHCHPEDLRNSELALLDHFLGQCPRYESEMRVRHQNGTWVWTRNQGEVVERDDQGRPSRVIGLMFDIGPQKESEGRLRTTLAEKESLLSELYHRTKNSMQLINAMLELKKQEMGNPALSQAFDDIENKILAMALVQEKLYQAETLSSIDLGSYVNDLMELFHSEMAPEGKHIEFKAGVVAGEAVEVTADIAIPCGLIISELVGNSVSHAFDSRDSGSISVSVYKDQSGEIHIEEWDDGVGLPQGYDPRRAGTVGLRTVIGIGEEQLHGMVSFGDRSSGFSCALRFKDVYYPRRV